jgi:flavin reductase (DIM6/NTAB) family NADH-FMN oxidoreductase RutF
LRPLPALLPSTLPRPDRAAAIPTVSKPPAAPEPARESTPPFTERHFRDALGQFATGVTVICTRAPDGRYIGFTANSFKSVSLDPPLIVWSLAHGGGNRAAFETASRYAVNVLAHDQVELARRFSRPHADRFAGVPYRIGAAGAPLIEGCVAWFECRHHAIHRAGDHVLFIGEVDTCERRPGIGLVFHHGRYGSTHALVEK